MSDVSVASTSWFPSKSVDDVDTSRAVDVQRYLRRLPPELTLTNQRAAQALASEPSTGHFFERRGSFPSNTSLSTAHCPEMKWTARGLAGKTERFAVPEASHQQLLAARAFADLESYILANASIQQEQGAVEARIRELEKLTSDDNWDLENGRAISAGLWTLTRHVYATAKQVASRWVEPFVSPSGDGTIHLAWSLDGARFNLELCDDSNWHIAVRSTPNSTYRKSDVSPAQALRELRSFLM